VVSLTALWFPVLLAAILIFVVSSIIHMLLNYHRADHAALPDESKVLSAMRDAGVGPGDYFFPHGCDRKEMTSPEMIKKFEQGPVGFLTVAKSGPRAMGAALAQWFVYTVVIGFFVAYVVSRTVPAGAEYLQIFRVAGAVAFLAYAGAVPVASIWGKRNWGTTVRHTIDAFLYALATAGSFAGFWPA
jgi:hypothetical protein